MVHNLSILGSTGSIGTQTLDVVDKLGLKVVALAAYRNIELLEVQIRKYRPQLAAVYDEFRAKQLRDNIKDTDTQVLSGMDGLIAAATIESAELVVNAVVGMVGLQPTLAAVQAKKDIALANKETLVAGGDLVTDAVRENGVRLLPVDSEHSAIFQSLQGFPKERIEKILLTASGGPFRGRKREELVNITWREALKHPNWTMGRKITIDSSTLVNKGLEVIEAKWLFGVPVEKIEVLVHPQSIVHSAVQFTDGAIKAQLGAPDMRLPIQYALSFPERLASDFPRADLFALKNLTFEKPDLERFPNLGLAYEAMRRGGNIPCVLNAANEVANLAFRESRCGFLQMSDIISETMAKAAFIAKPTYEDYVATDLEARKIANSFIR